MGGCIAFLAGAAPAAAGAIIGAAIPLAGAIGENWQYAVLAGAALALLVLRRGVVATLLAAGVLGVAAGLLGAPLPRYVGIFTVLSHDRSRLVTKPALCRGIM